MARIGSNSVRKKRENLRALEVTRTPSKSLEMPTLLRSGASERSKIQFCLTYVSFDVTALLRPVLSKRLRSVLTFLSFIRSHCTASNYNTVLPNVSFLRSHCTASKRSALTFLSFIRSHCTASNCALYDSTGAVRRHMRI